MRHRTPPAGRRLLALVVAIVASLAAVVWWAWPTLTRDDRPGVLVVADDFIAGGQRSLELRAREDGRTVRWVELDPAWCADPSALASLVERAQPERVVVSAAPSADTLAGALRDRRPVVVVQPPADATSSTLVAAGAVVVDPERLIGTAGDDPRRPCEWWERCELDGRIAVRDPSGELTIDGQERVARMIVAAL